MLRLGLAKRDYRTKKTARIRKFKMLMPLRDNGGSACRSSKEKKIWRNMA